MFVAPCFALVVTIFKFIYKIDINFKRDALFLLVLPVTYTIVYEMDIGYGKTLSNVIVEPLIISYVAILLLVQKYLLAAQRLKNISLKADLISYFLLCLFVVIIGTSIPSIPE